MVITVRVDAKTDALLTRRARRRAQTKSDIVRDAIQRSLERDERGIRGAERYRAVAHLIGCFDAGDPHLSEDLGRRFAEAIGEAHRARGAR